MSKQVNPGVWETAPESAETVDAELAELLGEARRLRTATPPDPRRGRWPASDYY